MNFLEEYHELLCECNKPYQYVGGEFLSYNKSFDDAKVRYLFAFPDKYEIGISNLGVRVIYGTVNNTEEYMADRIYAPEVDFKEILEKQNKELYALESKMPMRAFDIVGFSLQYELAYPTVLKMLEMGRIPIKGADRGEDDPIIIAGGPCTFNPNPMSEFIDGFCIGDGEEISVEICDVIKFAKENNLTRDEKLKKLSELKGLYVPRYPKVTEKRLVQLTYDNALKAYPIPFSTSVHDRATIEIRRGCTRMCRFCQPGHVTLPVRERSAEDIIKISKELVKNTGYDEYSLLSLSSNDYSNIKDVIKELAVDFDKKKVSVSLPSQRIDGFNLELANLVQEVRKSAMTLAPEAGSQRLRDVIKKNITREQIINAALTLYENGWSKIKFYFIVGLPTERYEDLDEMAELLGEIRYKSRYIKKIKELKHSLDITCTLSIFVPKPFTPFQWAPQVDLDELTERIHYLLDKTKKIKGVKINYHEKFISQVEAVLTRGDKSLCKYIEALYKKGCYLDAWDECFDKDVWKTTAQECGFSLKDLACKEYSLDEELPWEIINTGLDKEWLKSEYKAALSDFESPNIVPTCEQKCVNCGVCRTFKTHKVMAPIYKTQVPEVKKLTHEEIRNLKIPTFRYRVKLTKKGLLRYFSHLDWMGTFLKALGRADIDVAFSQGYNPMMKVSLGIALPLFLESECELVDIELKTEISEEELKQKLQEVVPNGCTILEVNQIDKNALAIDHAVQWAKYKVSLMNKNLHNFEELMYNMNKVLSSDEILLTKKNKKGILKTTNIKPSIKSYEFEDECLSIVLKTGQSLDIPALRVDDLMKILAPDILFDIKRVEFFDIDGNKL